MQFRRHLSWLLAGLPLSAQAAGVDAIIILPTVFFFVLSLFLATALAVLYRGPTLQRGLLVAVVIVLPLLAAYTLVSITPSFATLDSLILVLALLAFSPLIIFVPARLLLRRSLVARIGQDEFRVLYGRDASPERQKNRRFQVVRDLLIILFIFVWLMVMLLSGSALI